MVRRFQTLEQRMLLAADLSMDLAEPVDASPPQVWAGPPDTSKISINSTAGAQAAIDLGTPETSVVSLASGSFVFCTGTVIGPTSILTAEHCTTGTAASSITILFHQDNDTIADDSRSVISKVELNPTNSLLDGTDLAILTLSSPVPSWAPPMTLAGTNPTGVVSTAVGFGRNGVGPGGAGAGSDGRRWASQNTVDAFGPAYDNGGVAIGGTSNIFNVDFDDGTSTNNTLSPGVTSSPTPLPLEGTVAQGDSGGPLLVDGQIVGVLSGGTTPGGSIGDISWWTGTLNQQAWIEGNAPGATFDNDGVGNTVTLPFDLFDGESFRWDVFGTGLIGDGTNDAYDFGHTLVGMPAQTTGTLELGGRQLVIGPATVGSVEVTRKVYVPDDEGYARFLEVVTNPTSATVTHTVSISTNLGSDGGTVLVAESNGDGFLSPIDHWVITDDFDAGGDPTILHVFDGPGGNQLTSTVAAPTGIVEYGYDLILAPGETQIVMHFGAQSADQATALAKATDITALGLGALDGLTATELSQIVNFDVGSLSSGRLFAYDDAASLPILEIDPVSGTVLNSFASPVAASGGPDFGMAFGGGELFVGGDQTATIFVLDPDTGATIRTIANPSGVPISGLAVIGNELFVLNDNNSQVAVIDLTTDAVVRTLPNLGFESLTAAGDRLLGFNGNLIVIDPLTGTFNPAYPLDAEGFGVVGGELFATSFDRIDVYELSTGNLNRSLTGFADLEALGADDPMPLADFAPYAERDFYSVNADAGGAIQIFAADLIANDLDGDGDALTFGGVAALPGLGTLVEISPGVLEYSVPAGTLAGFDFFSYSVIANGVTSTGFVDIELVVNQPPFASNDTFGTGVGVPLTFTESQLLLNDFDNEGPVFFDGLVSSPLNGNVVGTGTPGEFIYTPNPGFTGPDSFDYQVSDAGGLIDFATVTIGVGVTNLPLTLIDGDGFIWDVQGDGNINNGTSDAYDGGHDLFGFPSSGFGELEVGGRQVVIGPQPTGSVEVTRKVYVPDDQGFARFLEVVTNPTASTITYAVDIRTNLGSDGATNTIATSSGDVAFDSSDDWIVTDDFDASGDPTVIHVIDGAGGIEPAFATRSSDNIEYRYDLTLLPGQTQIVMHFGAQNANQATALSKAPDLASLGLGALAGLTATELSQIVNFDVGATGTISGTKWEDVDGDGLRDLNEPGLPGVQIYLDENDNGRLDAFELFTFTGFDNPSTPTDETGTYSFTNLSVGDYIVREVVPSGYIQTSPGGLITETFSVGVLNAGIGAVDNNTGTGWLMYSPENLFTRFAAAPPILGSLSNSEQLIAVRLNGGQWQYDNNSTWINFMPIPGDRLLAQIDFSADTISSLQGIDDQVAGVPAGYSAGDLVFFANQFNGVSNAGEFQVTGSFFDVTTNPSPPLTEFIGPTHAGIAAQDDNSGLGWLMYSPQNLFTRFAAAPPLNAGSLLNSEQLIAVRLDGSQWQYDNNEAWVDFTPIAGDRLIAEIDFTADTIFSLEGVAAQVNGMAAGYDNGDLTFVADQLAGVANDGEFQVFGTFFEVQSDPSGIITESVTPTNAGIGAQEANVGDGWIMFSRESLFTRFAAAPPLIAGSLRNSDHLIAVRFDGTSWQYDNNTVWTTFTPAEGDRLLAEVDFTADTIISLQGTSGLVDGIASGFLSGDLVFQADRFNGVANDGEFQVTGTFFDFATPSDDAHRIQLGDGQTIAGLDFGNQFIGGFGGISGTVFNDLNANGFRDVGEPGLAGWTIDLFANDEVGTFIGQATTLPDDPSTPSIDESGTYLFNDLPIGDYVLLNFSEEGWTSNGFNSVTVTADTVVTDVDFAAEFVGLDFGDAPDSYATTLAADGPRHTAVGATLGSGRDIEPDGQPSIGSDGDDVTSATGNSEDRGVSFRGSLTPGQFELVDVVVSDFTFLDAFIDFNADGDFNDPGEKVFDGLFLSPGQNTLNFFVPEDAPVDSLTHARFRVSDFGGLSPTGFVFGGEVEDVAVAIVAAEREVTVGVGFLGDGVAVADNATGSGWIMYSPENVFARFASAPPFFNNGAINAEQFIGVRLQAGQWQYNDNERWIDFDPIEGDRLMAEVNFDTDVVVPLRGVNDEVSGVAAGFDDGDVAFVPNLFAFRYNPGDFQVFGNFFTATIDTAESEVVLIGETNAGIAAQDNNVGTGWLMHSPVNLFDRFSAAPPADFGTLRNSEQLIAVRLNGSQWQYDNNTAWVNFTPISGDRLLAEVNFTTDTVTSLQGVASSVSGIQSGFLTGDLVFQADRFNNAANDGEFQVTGTFFVVGDGEVVSVGSLGSGIGVTDDATGLGFLMHSATNVFDRFDPDPLQSGPFVNASNLIAVRLVGSQWQFNNNSGWFDFSVAAGDRLLAEIDFDADTITSLQGQSGVIGGIDRGYLAGDLAFFADRLAGVANDGEFEVTGTSFII